MVKTKGSYTPGGTPISTLVNPLSVETGPTDSGEGHLLQHQGTSDPFQRRSNLLRSPIKENRSNSVVDQAGAIPKVITRCTGQTLHDKSDATGNFTLQVAESGKTTVDLEKENKDLLGRLEYMEQLYVKLSEEIEYLKRENENLKINRNSKEDSDVENIEPDNFLYFTDEEELKRETDWILKESKRSRKSKKRKAESSPEAEQSIERGQSCPDSKVVLPEPSQPKGSKSTKSITPKLVQPKEKPPPPINIVGVTSYPEIQSLMKSVTDKEYKVTALNNDVWKINTLDSDSYRTLSMKLNAEKYQWYTYENKQARPIKVMARGLHHTCSSNEIMEDLKSKGLKILDAVNIVKKERTENLEGNQTVSKRGLPLFMLVFDNKENVQDIYGIKGILHMKVKIEPMKRTTTRIPQCKKCQAFNHTQRYCGRDPRCVKCSGNHITQACTIGRDVPAKCANCKGQHPANYRGCEVAKQLQKLRDKTKDQPQNHENRRVRISNQMSQNAQPSNIGQRRSFAQVVKGSGSTKYMGSENNQIMENIMNSIEAITKRLDDQSNLNNMILDQLKKMQLPQRNPIKNVK